MQVDASIHNQVADVRQFLLGLTRRSAPRNELQLKGQVDMSKPTAIQGNLKLVADSLDVTSYYDLFSGERKPEEKQPAPSNQKGSLRELAPAQSRGGKGA